MGLPRPTGWSSSSGRCRSATARRKESRSHRLRVLEDSRQTRGSGAVWQRSTKRACSEAAPRVVVFGKPCTLQSNHPILAGALLYGLWHRIAPNSSRPRRHCHLLSLHFSSAPLIGILLQLRKMAVVLTLASTAAVPAQVLRAPVS